MEEETILSAAEKSCCSPVLHDVAIHTPPISPITEARSAPDTAVSAVLDKVLDSEVSELREALAMKDVNDNSEDSEVAENDAAADPKSKVSSTQSEENLAVSNQEEEEADTSTSAQITMDGVKSNGAGETLQVAATNPTAICLADTPVRTQMPLSPTSPITEGSLSSQTHRCGDDDRQPDDTTVVRATELLKEKNEVVISTEKDNKVFGDAEDTAVKVARDAVPPPLSSRSVPPHMRSVSKPTSLQHPNAQDTGVRTEKRLYPHHTNQLKHNWPTPIPRTSMRAHYPPAGYQPPRPPIDYDELNRTRAQLMKTRNDLDTERKINAEMRRTVGAEQQANIGAAMSDMLTDLLHKQAEALGAKAKAQEKELELQFREQKIAQLEVYLSDGQKQLHNQLEERGIRSMSAVDRANLVREVELKVRHQFSEVEGKIDIQVERLRHQEAALKVREQQYKVIVRDTLEADIREQVAQETQTKFAYIKSPEAEHERGLTKSRLVSGSGTPETALRQAFLEGYHICYRSQSSIYNIQNGNLAVDSPELSFLYDPTHPDNPHNIGLETGRMQAAGEKIKSISCTVAKLILRSKCDNGSHR
jgi:hypothetical protein